MQERDTERDVPSEDTLGSFSALHTTLHRRSGESRTIHDIARDGDLEELKQFLSHQREEGKDVDSLINARDEFGNPRYFMMR